MSDETTAKPEGVDPATAPEPATAAESTAGGPEPDGAGKDALAEAEAQVNDLRDRLLRAAAEMENLRRRTEREIADTRQYAVTGFASEVLSVADNLHRAIAAVSAEARADAAEQLAACLYGVQFLAGMSCSRCTHYDCGDSRRYRRYCLLHYASRSFSQTKCPPSEQCKQQAKRKPPPSRAAACLE